MGGGYPLRPCRPKSPQARRLGGWQVPRQNLTQGACKRPSRAAGSTTSFSAKFPSACRTQNRPKAEKGKCFPPPGGSFIVGRVTPCPIQLTLATGDPSRKRCAMSRRRGRASGQRPGRPGHPILTTKHLRRERATSGSATEARRRTTRSQVRRAERDQRRVRRNQREPERETAPAKPKKHEKRRALERIRPRRVARSM